MMDGDRLKRLVELLEDARSCARLTQWEEEFCQSMREKVETYGERSLLTDKQEDALKRIEAKVYA